MRVALAVIVLLASAAAHASPPASLPGRYAMELDPAQVLELRADGTGSLAAEPLRWTAAGGQLALMDSTGATEVVRYELRGDRLLLDRAGVTVALLRLPAKAPAGPRQEGTAAAPARSAQRAAPAADPRATATPVDEQLRKLLLSSAWCSFTFSGGSGAGGTYGSSRSSRVVFATDGTGTRRTGSERSSSGYGGTAAGQSVGGDAFRWQVRAGRLLVDVGQGFADVNLRVTQNSNGYPILNADGTEYATCR